MAAGQVVELHVVVEAATRTVSEASRIRFEVAPADPPRERVVELVGSEATAVGVGPSEPRTTVAAPNADGESVADARATFLREHPADFARHILVLREGDPAPERFHLLTWWTAERLAGRTATRLHFNVDIDGDVQAETAEPLEVGDVAGDERALSVRLRYEDESPMAEAEFEAVFAGGQRVRGLTGGDGTAEIIAPVGAGEVFRLFLLSYPQEMRLPGPPRPPQPVPPAGPPDVPPPPPPPVPVSELRPETVAVFAFDSAFPSPAVWVSLERVRTSFESSPDARAMVFGHTDQVGSDAYNHSLSERRAKAVLALLSHDLAMFDEIAAAEGWDLAVYQSMLRGLGCNPGAIDGKSGEMTRAATIGFQTEYNLGVYHTGATPRAHPDVAVDGTMSPATKAAIRDGYVAVSPSVPAERLTTPAFSGCGERHPISTRDDDNRRAVVAYFEAGRDLTELSPCDQYQTLVGEQRSDLRARRFSDGQWLREDDGTAQLSIVTSVPDRTSAEITVVRCEGPVPAPLPDSSEGGERPVLGPTLATVPARITGGICFGRWTSPAEDPFDPTAWLVDHDIEVEIVRSEDNAEPADDDPASIANLLRLDAVHPPVFVVEAGAHWGVGGPPGQRLTRIRFDDQAAVEGLAVRTDGTLVPFTGRAGLVEGDDAADVVSLALSDADVETEPAPVVDDPAVPIRVWDAVKGPEAPARLPPESPDLPVAPEIAPLEGGTRVAVRAAGAVAGDVTVEIAGSAATDVAVSPDGRTVFATTPPGAEGAADVVVAGAGSSPVTHRGALTYVGDLLSATRAAVRSYAVHLAEIREAATAASASGTFDDEQRALLKLDLELAGTVTNQVLAERSEATGTSLSDPDVNAVWLAAHPALRTLSEEAAAAVASREA